MPRTRKSKEDDKSKEPRAVLIPLEWYVPDDMVGKYATNFVVQQTGQEVVLSFFEAEKPILLGTPEEVEEKLSQLSRIRAKCVARIVVTPDKIPGIIEALNQTVFLTWLPNHRLLHPIPIQIRSLGKRGFMARFLGANLAMCGDTISEAVASLADDISDTFAIYSLEESDLGPEPEKQFRVLGQYIAE